MTTRMAAKQRSPSPEPLPSPERILRPARRSRQPGPWLRAELQRQLSGRGSNHPSKILADVAERTEDTIEQYYDIVEDLDVPTSSKNYSSWKDIIALYDDLDHRIDAICDAWEISLKYAKPADHKNEIVAPLSRDQRGRAPMTISTAIRL